MISMSPQGPFRLETLWTHATDETHPAYSLTLTNCSAEPVKEFSLCVNGPARIGIGAPIEGGTLTSQLSNHAELRPPDGFVLRPGASWKVVARAVSWPLHHWTDGANAAYLVLANNAVVPVTVTPTRNDDDTPPKRGSIVYPVPAKAPVTISVIPWPEHVTVSGARAAPHGLALSPVGPDAEAASDTFLELSASLFPLESLVRPTAEGGVPVDLAIEAGHGAEAYTIGFFAEYATLRATTRTGLLYGLITLGQILRGAKAYPETFLFPTQGEIVDRPLFGWRGSHLDTARQFYPSAEIKKFLQILAWNKLNRFHWHLTDDEAWRIEIDAYPELTAIGAWRGHGLRIPPLLGSGPEATGGYYTKRTVRELVALAGGLGITVVPEIDVPGHCYAALQSLPWLRDPAETGTYFSIQGFPNNCLNPGRAETFAFIETVFGELLDLFPSQAIHVGADEVPTDAWSGSPQAQTRFAQLRGSKAAALQADFLRRVQSFLTERGRTTGAWEEAALGGGIDKAHCYLNGWASLEINAKLAAEGFDVVACPAQIYYLEMANSAAWSEPGSSFAGWSDPYKLYAFDPAAGWGDDERRHLLGIQTCIWSEPMVDRGVFDRLVFPGLSALAESAWTRPESKSWQRFEALVGLMPILYGITETVALRGATKAGDMSATMYAYDAGREIIDTRERIAAYDVSGEGQAACRSGLFSSEWKE